MGGVRSHDDLEGLSKPGHLEKRKKGDEKIQLAGQSMGVKLPIKGRLGI